ncbi:hypothetical protein H5P28_12225 [Ruficoccus amylovorans]|uniref:Uncharacterized protein n=1 Tax=Ruficoccus amylovorans TaxID=1804625 RepID=A0A842HEL0_9BACT|nr:hypothetical protein [Ruficoccus amylovorans]MBC2595025.1 hypothetical protein [Ruficoccus amylovorans]
MSNFFLVGGLIGFCMSFLVVFFRSGQIDDALRDGMIGCLVMAFLFKNLQRVFMQALIEVAQKRHKRKEQVDEQ